MTSFGGFRGTLGARTPRDFSVAALVAAGVLVACGGSKHDQRDDGAEAGASGEGGTPAAGKGGTAGTLAGRGGTSSGSAGGGTGGAAAAAGGSGVAGIGAGGEGAAEGGNSGAGAGNAGNEQGGEAGSGGDRGVHEGPLAPFIEAFCETARTCCDTAGFPEGALSACEAGFASHYDAVTSIEDGTVTVDTAALSACVAAYAQAGESCSWTAVFTDCPAMLLGTAADGEPCRSVFECDRSDGPKICLKLQDSAEPEVGVCVAPERAGADEPCGGSCAEGSDCSLNVSNPDASIPTAFCHESDGLFCNFGYGCAPLVEDGEVCDTSAACHAGSVCLSTCEPLKANGATCQFIFECAEGLTCESDTCVPEPVASDYTCTGYAPFVR